MPVRRRKRNVTIRIDRRLLLQAKALGIDVSRLIDRKLAEEVRRRRWRTENAAAIRAYNDFVVREGIFGEQYRRF